MGFAAGAALALALAGCLAAPAGHPSMSHAAPTPAPTRTPAASAALAGSEEHQENNFYEDETVPAGGSIDVPVSFEGTSNPTVYVNSTTPGITASFGGVALDAYSIPGGLSSLESKPIANPKDGLLHISNPGPTQAIVTVVTLIYSTRHLTITPSTDFVVKGGTLSIDARVSQATPGEVASAYLQDYPTGAKTSFVLTKVGKGHWTGQVTPATGGRKSISVETSGERVRIDHTLISVSRGNLTLGTGFTERLVDTDHDGLANSLELTATVTAKEPSSYSLVAHLVDSTGKEIEIGGGEVSVVAGTQRLPIGFYGPGIYGSRLSGPYRLVDVTLTEQNDASNTEARADDLGATQAYDYHVFQH